MVVVVLTPFTGLPAHSVDEQSHPVYCASILEAVRLLVVLPLTRRRRRRGRDTGEGGRETEGRKERRKERRKEGRKE